MTSAKEMLELADELCAILRNPRWATSLADVDITPIAKAGAR